MFKLWANNAFYCVFEMQYFIMIIPRENEGI